MLDARPVRVWNQVARTSDVTSIRDVIHFFVDFAADRELFAQVVAMVVDVLNTSIAREEVHSFRDCVDDQLYFAQDMRQDTIVLSAKVVREIVHIIIDRRNGQMLWVMRV